MSFWQRLLGRRRLPSAYDPESHYNCFIESALPEDRQGVYAELRRTGAICTSGFLPDGRQQLVVENLYEAITAYNRVAKEHVAAVKLSKIRMIELMARESDIEIGLTTKPGDLHHVQKVHLSQLVLDSEAAFRMGVSYHKNGQLESAIECYDQALRDEPDDLRAWHCKIMALAEGGKHKEAIRVADDILTRCPNVGFLWEAKGRTYAGMGQAYAVQAGDCVARACELDSSIEREYLAQINHGVDKWFQELKIKCKEEGMDPKSNVGFWFGKFGEFVDLDDAEKAIICLQMAETAGPDHSVVIDASTMRLIPPGHHLETEDLPNGARIEPLRGFMQTMARRNERLSGSETPLEELAPRELPVVQVRATEDQERGRSHLRRAVALLDPGLAAELERTGVVAGKAWLDRAQAAWADEGNDVNDLNYWLHQADGFLRRSKLPEALICMHVVQDLNPNCFVGGLGEENMMGPASLIVAQLRKAVSRTSQPLD
jgi:tetratricopeptide (TPR) repeat protein